jgi:DNA polymerase (family 10)
MTKRDIGKVLKEIGFFLRLNGDNPYKARAYEQAGMALLASPFEAQELVESNRLTKIQGIGPATASVISELLTTGTSTVHEKLRGRFPSSLVELGDVPGLTMQQILQLYEHGGVASVVDLQAACRTGALLSIPGIGPKIQAKLVSSLGEYQRGVGYHLYADMVEEAERLERAIASIHIVKSATLAGAMRRKLEVMNELRFVACCQGTSGARKVLEGMRAVPNIGEITEDEHSIRAESAHGVPIIVRVVSSTQYGCVLLQETGSEEHIEMLLKRFEKRGMHDWKAVAKRFPGATEEILYRAIDLPYIPPELREGRDEVELAEGMKSLSLLTARDIQGCFHVHTDYSDGTGTISGMVQAARDRGFCYVGISDHSQSAHYANGLKEPRIREQWAEMKALQKEFRDIHIFRGIEADILPDGSMDYPDDILAEFDFVIASVHSRFNLPETEQTQRVCRALANPYVTMLGHPTGRLLLSRPGYRVDLNRVVATAAAHHKLLEINGSRYRLDLDWRWARSAKTQGVKFCVNPDAHAVDEFINVALGVNVARKAGLHMDDVVNVRSLPAVKAFLRDARQ